MVETGLGPFCGGAAELGAVGLPVDWGCTFRAATFDAGALGGGGAARVAGVVVGTAGDVGAAGAGTMKAR